MWMEMKVSVTIYAFTWLAIFCQVCWSCFRMKFLLSQWSWIYEEVPQEGKTDTQYTPHTPQSLLLTCRACNISLLYFDSNAIFHSPSLYKLTKHKLTSSCSNNKHQETHYYKIYFVLSVNQYWKKYKVFRKPCKALRVGAGLSAICCHLSVVHQSYATTTTLSVSQTKARLYIEANFPSSFEFTEGSRGSIKKKNTEIAALLCSPRLKMTVRGWV